jgi:hypothetical protein
MKQIATALVKAQKGFAPALKTSTNPHFKSKYADLAACVEAVIDSLNSNGIALVQQTHEHPNGILVETVFLHESGEMLNCGKLFFPAQKNDPQGFMACLTYGRRASLMAACGIAPEDDDGNTASRTKEPVREPVKETKIPPAISDQRLLAAIAKIKSGEYTTDKLRASFRLTGEQNEKLISELSNA